VGEGAAPLPLRVSQERLTHGCPGGDSFLSLTCPHLGMGQEEQALRLHPAPVGIVVGRAPQRHSDVLERDGSQYFLMQAKRVKETALRFPPGNSPNFCNLPLIFGDYPLDTESC
jgi:hypothetical protein